MGKIQDSTINPGKKTKIRELIDNFGLPRLIIAGFLLALFILAPIVGADLPTQITNTINRFSWNAVLVLAMVPMVHSGCGLNFGLPLGIISGLLGATMSIQFGFTGPVSFFMAILIATPFALIFGGGYGWLLNKIKGGEMMIATYVGFSSVSFMCMMWLYCHTAVPPWFGDCQAKAFVQQSHWRVFTIRHWPISCRLISVRFPYLQAASCSLPFLPSLCGRSFTPRPVLP